MQTVDLHSRDGVATITMQRPEARNALSAQMKDELAAAFAAVAGDRAVRAVILAGSGGVFSGGGDIRGMLEARATMTVDSGRERMRSLHPLIRSMLELDKPLVAAVDGAAFGAGFSIALMADFVLASPRARFCMSFLRIGLVPDFAAMYSLPRVVGVQRAKELMLSAREVGADEALRLGIAMELVPSDGLLERAGQIARSMTAASPMAVSLVKSEVGLSLSTGLRATLAREAEQQALCLQTDSHRRAVDRFLAKEPTEFLWPAPPPG